MEVGVDERLEDVLRELTCLVDLRRPRRDLVVSDFADGFAEQLVLLGEHERVK
jgi:hypothetical protein